MKCRFDRTITHLKNDFLSSERATDCKSDRYQRKSSNLGKFSDFVGVDTPVYRITKGDAKEFCEWIAGASAPSTYLQVVRDCVRMFDYAVRHRYIVDSPLTFTLMNAVHDQFYAPVGRGKAEMRNKHLMALVKKAVESNSNLVCQLMELMEPVEV